MKLHFRKNLIYLRKKNGYSQIGLANEIGITKGVIGSYEEGRAMPAAENLIKLSCLFGVTVDAILQKNLSEGVELPDLSIEERLAKIEQWIYGASNQPLSMEDNPYMQPVIQHINNQTENHETTIQQS